MASTLSRLRPERVCLALLLVAILTLIALHRENFDVLLNKSWTVRAGSNSTKLRADADSSSTRIPFELLRLGVYKAGDFWNEGRVAPPFWECNSSPCNTSSSTTKVKGPCYVPPRSARVNWEREANRSSERIPRYHASSGSSTADANDLADYCRPGFIIIGAGKCGTSSLYHYLSDHPRVLPAREKQIHYFKYYTTYPLKWYYDHFPTATDFLASGALLTGEASPGYMPYPDVAQRLRMRMPGPRIIALGRDPLERSYSSYRYNYVAPTIDEMRNGKFRPRILPDQPDEYYEPYLFTFEEMIRAELANLRDCLSPGGRAEIETIRLYAQQLWVKEEMSRRARAGLPPMVDIIGTCYGKPISKSVIRAQWADMVSLNPDKVLTSSNTHLKESLIGRSLYVLPLDWWYALFRKDELYFMCTEELSDMTGESLDELAQFLGLPAYNFSSIVQGGSYNVGGHKGYDEETAWDEVHRIEATRSAKDALPEDLRRELLDFFEPFNERLFNLTGRRCTWG